MLVSAGPQTARNCSRAAGAEAARQAPSPPGSQAGACAAFCRARVGTNRRLNDAQMVYPLSSNVITTVRVPCVRCKSCRSALAVKVCQ